jgi:hypothetical protein
MITFLVAAGCTEQPAQIICPESSKASLAASDDSAVAGVSPEAWLAQLEGTRPAVLEGDGGSEPVSLTVRLLDPGIADDVFTDGLPARGKVSSCGMGDHLRLAGVTLQFKVVPESGAPVIADVWSTWQVYGPDPIDGIPFGEPSPPLVDAVPDWLQDAADAARNPACDDGASVRASIAQGFPIGDPWNLTLDWFTGPCTGILFEVPAVP